MAPYALAAGLPLVCYLVTASAHGYWLDAGEFIAAATDLGISHPPGHPLAALLGFVATLVPLGSLAFRVALMSAACAALAAGFLFRAIDTTIGTLGLSDRRVSVPLALAATWTVAGSYGWWFQAVRPEVYALQALLLCLALERIVHLEAAWPTRDMRPLLVASLSVGLALANHHLLAFLVLPAMAPTWARVLRSEGVRPLIASLGAVATGLMAYAYLPARAFAGADLNLGNPSSLGRLWWVVTAQAFQKNTGGGVPQPLGDRFFDIGAATMESLHWPVLLLGVPTAIAGAYALLRSPRGRRIGVLWVVVLAVFVAARAWLGFVRSNPDALGYLMPAFGAGAALVAAFVAALLVSAGAGRAQARPAAAVLAWLLATGAACQFGATASEASLAHFAATDAFDEVSRRALPARAVVIAHDPQTVFRLWGSEAAERTRPDVTVVPMPLLAYPGMVNELVRRAPELTELLRGALLDGALDMGALQSLAALRPVMVEMDPRVPVPLYDTLVANGLWLEVLPDSAYAEDRRAGRRRHAQAMTALTRALGEEVGERETKNRLLWHRYMSALFFAGTGQLEAARAEVALGRAINRQAAELIALEGALEQALAAENEGPLDITPFTPRRLE